ncbi:MAG: Ig-like domain-containing protein [Sulfurimonas sp.]
MSILKQIILVLLLALSLQAQSGLSQKHLVSLSPENSAQDISADTSIEIEYDLAISKHSLHKRTVVLKDSDGKKIKGKVRVKNRNTLIFTPSKELERGEYRVKVKQLRLQDYNSNTRFKRYAKRFCSYFYDDVKKCRLYRYACRVKSKQIKYSFIVDDNKPKVLSLTLSKTNIQLNEDNTTTIRVNAKYDNNETLEVTEDAEWILSNSNIISIDKNIITPLSEGTTTLRAKFNSQTTAEISVTVYKEINGYKLPPEPDETLNNSTLLGIDVNNNGVRDDVEIYVIKRYAKDPEFPKTKTALAMQYAWAEQQIIDNPVIESRKFMTDSIDCETYWFHQKQKEINQKIIELGETNFDEAIQATIKAGKWRQEHSVFNDTAINDKIYNTRERIERSFEFNQASSGHIFNGREAKLEYCHTNLNELGE